MASTPRAASRTDSKASEESSSIFSSAAVEEEAPPKPVSSDSEGIDASDDDDASAHAAAHDALQASLVDQDRSGASKLFVPYRTLGIVSSGQGFHLVPHAHSGNSMACIPIGNRFQLMQLDKLRPVLVSQSVTGTISCTVVDASLSVTVVAHARPGAASQVTLFHRTKPIHSLVPSRGRDWSIVDLLHLGKLQVAMTKGEKKGSVENGVLVAAVLARQHDDDDDASDVSVVGDDDDDVDVIEANDIQEDNGHECHAQVVLILVTRQSFSIQRRVRITQHASFIPRVAMHPPTYVNKVLVGGSGASPKEDSTELPMLMLVNVRTGKLIHDFRCIPNVCDTSTTCLEQSPAVDTIAVGTSDGAVHLINLRHDQLLFSLSHKGSDVMKVTITSISFRSDSSALQYGIAPMAVGRSDGKITIWDLTAPEGSETDRSILCEMDHVHIGGVAKLQYLPQEPLLLSSGVRSNAMLVHIFDNPDHSARLLRQRQGHSAPPALVRYMHAGAGGGGGLLANAGDGTDASSSCHILSCGGKDRALRLFSTARTVLDKEFGQGKGLSKRAKKSGLTDTTDLLLPPITGMAFSESRSRDWGDIVTIHQNHPFAYVWSSKRGSQSGPLLRQSSWNVSAMKAQPPSSTHATAVAMSACGNFAIVGTRSGTIYRYNMQSGLSRGSFPRGGELGMGKKSKGKVPGDLSRTTRALEKSVRLSSRAANLDKREREAEKKAKSAKLVKEKLVNASHQGRTVTGLAVDSVNKTLISVGADAKLILWNFHTQFPVKTSPYMLPSAATRLVFVRESDIAAIALDDFSVLLFDCAMQLVVRRFGGTRGHSGPISDIAFSSDARTLYSASLDMTIRVWDVPTSTCVDWLKFDHAPSSVTISPTGEFLATSHVGQLGLSMWSDKSSYETVHINGTKLSAPYLMNEPLPWSASKMAITGEDFLCAPQQKPIDEEHAGSQTECTQKAKGLVTFSDLPPAHWKNLFHLELVKMRNKPKEAPKKPSSAPFFLQWRGEPNETEIDDDQSNRLDDWKAAWSDDDDDAVANSSASESASGNESAKRRKMAYHRSTLATVLQRCASLKRLNCFQPATDYLATLGPSMIDVEISSLCRGAHDVDDGIPLLLLACEWLAEAAQSAERYEVINAYIHRFLLVHGRLLAGLEQRSAGSSSADETQKKLADEELQLAEAVRLLREANFSAGDQLRVKMQKSLCLLHHFSRMV